MLRYKIELNQSDSLSFLLANGDFLIIMKVLILLGGNEGDTPTIFQLAIELIARRAGRVVAVSSLYESSPWGLEAKRNFLNCVLELETTLEPEVLLDTLLKVEGELGRKRPEGIGYASRPIDIDILFIDNLVIDSDALIVPHPRLHLRRFTLLPLNELWAGWLHPVFGKTVGDLLQDCEDQGMVKLHSHSLEP